MTGFDPLSALILATAVVAATGFVDGTIFPSCVLIAAAGLAVAAGLPKRPMFWRSLGLFLFFAVTSAWVYAVAPAASHDGRPDPSTTAAIVVSLRIVAVGLVSTAFVMLTDLSALSRTLVHRAGLSRRVVHGVIAAIQFGPAIADDWRMARQIARATETGWARVLPRPGIFLSVLAGAVRRAADAAIALEMRGVAAAEPTRWRVPRAGRRDHAVVAAVLAALLVVAVISIRHAA